MKLTLTIQQGDDGPVRIVAAGAAQAPRLIRQWQGGSVETLHVRHAHEQTVTEARIACAQHRIRDDWHHPDALRALTDALGPGLGALASELDRAAKSHDTLRRLAGWAA
ncbi:MAG: hypothetical protein RIF41_07605 [Polyangiaceae bacterium]